MGLKGKTVLITGGGTGIGAGAALALEAEGCRVAIAGRREDKLREVAAAFSGEPAILCRAADVGDRSSAQDLVAWAEKELGQIDILVQSAGVNVVKRKLGELDPADWDKLLNVNATGAFNVMHAALPAMRKRRDGLIINISSIAGKRASMLGGVAYSAAKFAMCGTGPGPCWLEASRPIRRRPWSDAAVGRTSSRCEPRSATWPTNWNVAACGPPSSRSLATL